MLPQGSPAARRTATIACAAVALLAILGAIAFVSMPVGNDCGSGWSAARKPLPEPLLTDAEKEQVTREKRNPYEAATEKARPTEQCRRAGEKRLITAGLGSLLLLVPAAGVFIFAFLYWPSREE